MVKYNNGQTLLMNDTKSQVSTSSSSRTVVNWSLYPKIFSSSNIQLLTGAYTHIFFVASIRSSRPWISVCIRSFILW